MVLMEADISFNLGLGLKVDMDLSKKGVHGEGIVNTVEQDALHSLFDLICTSFLPLSNNPITRVSIKR